MCADCSAKDEALRTLSAELDKTNEEVAGLHMQRRRDARAEQGLRAELTKLRAEDPTSEAIVRLLELWRDLCVPERSRNRVAIGLDGDRAKFPRSALKSKTKGSPQEREQICADAIRGLALRPFVVDGRRMGAGPPEKRYCDVEHALGSEKRIEEHAAFYRQSQARPAEWLREAWQRACDVENQWMDLWMEAVRSDELDRQILERPTLFLVKDEAA